MKVYTGGTFDLFHYGHVEFLKNCATLGDVVVSLNTDEFVTQYKSSPTVMSLPERMRVVESCRYVSSVVVNSGGKDSKPAIESINPDIIAVGDDWKEKDYYSQMGFNQDWLDQRGISIHYIPYTKTISTTQIRERLK